MTTIWNTLAHWLSINTIAFTVLGYPMSYVELFGTIFNLWSVWLVARQRILTWPVGLVGVGLFLALFYQIQLYADVIEQIYYLGASLYGWWMWRRRPAGAEQTARWSAPGPIALGVGATLLLALALGWITSRLHLWLPEVFAVAATYAYLDALTTIMSFAATLLMAHRRIECWVYWILVDVIGIGLYFVKDVRLIAGLYVIFLALALNGLRLWLLARRAPPAAPQPAAAA